ncbi:MAG: flagellar biosynthesis protein FlhF [Planctomycetaceae bacterium]|nr:flagellar biosynthesis protein FlhF [Planctomycetaceae bacterium]
MSDVRTYRAASMQQALDLVRSELGSDAVILHTRQISGRQSLLPWRRKSSEVEITASLEVNISTPAVSSSSSRNSTRHTPAARQQAAASTSGRTSTAGRMAAAQHTDTDDGVIADFSRFSRFQTSQPAAEETFGETVRRHAQEWPADSTYEFPAPAPQPAAPHRTAPAHRPSAASPAAPAVTTPAAAPGSEQLARKLARIERMLEEMGRSGIPTRDEVPPELFHLYTELIDAEMDHELARHLMTQLSETCSRTELQDTARARTMLTALVEARLQCSGPIEVTPGRQKVVALVGATGVGKTTTIAKLAANFRLRDEVRIGLVTVDTYRIAAVEQLRTYAEIIDLPMKVVAGPHEMQQALDELAGLDLILIDTAGRSPRDDLQIEELRSLLAAARVDEVHLVLSMSSGLRSLKTSVEKFASASPSRLILTKLDEATGMGPLLSIASQTGLPVSYLTTGQGVPDDIEPAGNTRLARLILNEDRLPVG